MSVLRSVYLVVPAILTLVATILIILVFLDQLSRTSSVLNSLYFLKIETGAFTLASRVGINVADWYTVGLWNYCSGNSGSTTPTYCSPAKAFYYFDPLEVLNLKSLQGTVDALAPKEWESALNTYEAVSKWMFIAYLVSIILLGLSTLFGAFAFCMSRGSSCLLTLLTLFSAGFTIAAAATATAMFITIKALLKEKLGSYGISSDLGTKILTFSWVSAAFALIASFAWLLSCCCSGDRSHKSAGRAKSFGPDVYDRVPEPYGNRTGYYGHQTAPMSGAYEPYRHESKV